MSKKRASLIKRIFNEAQNNFRYAWGIKQIEHLIETNPELKDEKVLLNLGLLYDHLALKRIQKRMDYEDRALKIYRKVLKMNPKYKAIAIWSIGRIWWHRRSKKAVPYALKVYHLAKKLGDKNGIWIQQVGLVYDSIGQKKEAEQWLLKGVKNDPKNQGVYINIVDFYVRRKKNQEAKKYAIVLARLF